MILRATYLKRRFHYALLLTLLITPSVWGIESSLGIFPKDQKQVVRALNAAKTSITGCAYKMDYAPIIGALCHQAKRGIHVNLLVEETPFQHSGSDNAQTPMQKLLDCKVQIVGADEDAPQRHAKFFILDDKTVLFLTANLDEETFLGTQKWRATKTEGDTPTQDIVLAIEDKKMATEMQAWLNHAENPEKHKAPKDGDVTMGPYKSTRATVDAAIRSATKSLVVWQQSLQDESVVKELIAAQKRGVKVEVIMTKDPFHKGEGNPMIKPLAQLKASGATVILFKSHERYIHMKGMLIDGDRFLFTTSNFYGPSLDKGFEVTLMVKDPTVIEMLKGLAEENRKKTPIEQ